MTSLDLGSPLRNNAISGRASIFRNITWFLTIPLFTAALVDVPRQISIGGFSLLGVLAIAELLLVLIALLAQSTLSLRVLRLWLPCALFLIWSLVRAAMGPLPSDGLQNEVLYVLFALLCLLSASAAETQASNVRVLVEIAMRWIDIVGLGLVSLNLLLFGFPSGDETGWFLGPRTFALMALNPLSWHLARRYYGDRTSGLLAMGWLITIFMTFSRTAAAAALILFGVATVLQVMNRPGRRVGAAVVAICAVGGVVLFLTHSQAAQQRMFGGDASLQVGGVALNTTGRLTIWGIVALSASQAPITGHGIGSSVTLLKGVIDNIAHPHNDYLRIWHDLGLIGLFFILASFSAWFVSMARAFRRAKPVLSTAAIGPLTGIFALLGLMIGMLTDNSVVYSPVIAPAAALIGIGVGNLAWLRDSRPRASDDQ